MQFEAGHPFIDYIHETILVEVFAFFAVYEGLHFHLNVELLIAAMLLEKHTLAHFQAHPPFLLYDCELTLLFVFCIPLLLLVEAAISFVDSIHQIALQEVVVYAQLEAIVKQLVVDFC